MQRLQVLSLLGLLTIAAALEPDHVVPESEKLTRGVDSLLKVVLAQTKADPSPALKSLALKSLALKILEDDAHKYATAYEAGKSGSSPSCTDSGDGTETLKKAFMGEVSSCAVVASPSFDGSCDRPVVEGGTEKIKDKLCCASCAKRANSELMQTKADSSTDQALNTLSEDALKYAAPSLNGLEMLPTSQGTSASLAVAALKYAAALKTLNANLVDDALKYAAAAEKARKSGSSHSCTDSGDGTPQLAKLMGGDTRSCATLAGLTQIPWPGNSCDHPVNIGSTEKIKDKLCCASCAKRANSELMQTSEMVPTTQVTSASLRDSALQISQPLVVAAVKYAAAVKTLKADLGAAALTYAHVPFCMDIGDGTPTLAAALFHDITTCAMVSRQQCNNITGYFREGKYIRGGDQQIKDKLCCRHCAQFPLDPDQQRLPPPQQLRIPVH